MKKPHEDPNCPCEGCRGGILTIVSQNVPVPLVSGPRDFSFYFTLPDEPEPFLKFCENGEVFVRGEKIDDNLKIYEAVRAFFERSTRCTACGGPR